MPDDSRLRDRIIVAPATGDFADLVGEQIAPPGPKAVAPSDLTAAGNVISQFTNGQKSLAVVTRRYPVREKP